VAEHNVETVQACAVTCQAPGCRQRGPMAQTPEDARALAGDDFTTVEWPESGLTLTLCRPCAAMMHKGGTGP